LIGFYGFHRLPPATANPVKFGRVFAARLDARAAGIADRAPIFGDRLKPLGDLRYVVIGNSGFAAARRG
jgi:hypothetical protein